MTSFVRMVSIALLRFYQTMISPVLGNHCRFHPTCSEYAIRCIKSQGLLRGAHLSTYRLLRCQPFAQGGYDPVPGTEQ